MRPIALIVLVFTGCGSVTGNPFGPESIGGSTEDPLPVIVGGEASANIVVDQFGYRPGSEKIAVIRSPVNGYDADESFAPGSVYRLMDAVADTSVFEAAPVAWNGGRTDASSGDKAWWFDFSSVTRPGTYYVRDVEQDVRSDVFVIRDSVYRDVLVQTVRMLYYQRDGCAKDAAYAGADWADGAAHMRSNQGPGCKQYNGTATRDLHGGWWDAGDQNKYTNWANDYVIELLYAYAENPSAFTDDTNIPESGNGIPDLLDEVKFELDWLVRMQNADGSLLSIVGQDGAALPDTRPSRATGACTYGPATTAATMSGAAAFAFASRIYAPLLPTFAADLRTRAVSAWTWANLNPAATFNNAGRVGAGEQETDATGRATKRLQAAVFLYALTGDVVYRAAVDVQAALTQLLVADYVDLFASPQQDALLAYTALTGATQSVKADILGTYRNGIGTPNNQGSDPYLAYLYTYVWGSNQNKAMMGTTLYNVIAYAIADDPDMERLAERYVHYIHGVNPLGLVYLSRMQDFGAARSVTRFYHTWFAHGSDWDAEGVSTYGPPPGFLVGGPNPTYAWNGCCPSSCSGVACGAMPTPPTGQPPQKAYADMNDNWPLDTWQFSEPSLGYQTRYIRLLSKFVR